MKSWPVHAVVMLGLGLGLTAGCGSSPRKTDSGTDSAGRTGGASGTGGGATGGAGTGGGAGSGGETSTGGTKGGTGGAAGTPGATAGRGGDVGGSGGRGGNAGGASGSSAGAASGGRGGNGGRGGTAGGASGGRGGNGLGGAGGTQACGRNTCSTGQYCCNSSCGLCVPTGAACIQIACTDGGILGDAASCLARPQQDSMCSGQTPHLYACLLTELPAPCVVNSIGDLTNTYCCP